MPRVSDPHLLQNDALGVRGSSERVGLPPGAQMDLLVVEVGPHLGAPVLDVLAGRADAAGLAHREAGLLAQAGAESKRKLPDTGFE